MNPVVSVVMAVHNGGKLLADSIESILNQTFFNFEFVIVNDGSTDLSSEVIRSYAKRDARIVAIHRKQKGLTRSLNEAIARSAGALIARQDADDISLPHRLAMMVNFLETNSSISAAGSWCEKIDAASQVVGEITHPIDHDQISWEMIGCTAIAHPSAVIRRDSFTQYGAYNESCIYAQDYELWTRWISKGARLANIPERLVKYRVSNMQISVQFSRLQSESAIESAVTYVSHLLDHSVARQQVVGLRQLIGQWPLDADAFSAISLLARLLALRRFDSVAKNPSTVSRLTKKIVDAAQLRAVADGGGRLSSVLVTAVSICPRLLATRAWWMALAKAAIRCR